MPRSLIPCNICYRMTFRGKKGRYLTMKFEGPDANSYGFFLCSECQEGIEKHVVPNISIIISMAKLEKLRRELADSINTCTKKKRRRRR